MIHKEQSIFFPSKTCNSAFDNVNYETLSESLKSTNQCLSFSVALGRDEYTTLYQPKILCVKYVHARKCSHAFSQTLIHFPKNLEYSLQSITKAFMSAGTAHQSCNPANLQHVELRKKEKIKTTNSQLITSSARIHGRKLNVMYALFSRYVLF